MEFVIKVSRKDNGREKNCESAIKYHYWVQLIPLDGEAEKYAKERMVSTKLTNGLITFIDAKDDNWDPTVRDQYIATAIIWEALYWAHWKAKGKVKEIIWTFQPDWQISDGERIEQLNV